MLTRLWCHEFQNKTYLSNLFWKPKKYLNLLLLQHHWILGIICQFYIIPGKKHILLTGFLVSQIAPYHTTDVLWPANHILSKSTNLKLFRVIIIIISINFSIRKTLCFILDKIELFVFFYFLYFYILSFTLFFFCLLSTYFVCIFSILFYLLIFFLWKYFNINCYHTLFFFLFFFFR